MLRNLGISSIECVQVAAASAIP